MRGGPSASCWSLLSGSEKGLAVSVALQLRGWDAPDGGVHQLDHVHYRDRFAGTLETGGNLHDAAGVG